MTTEKLLLKGLKDAMDAIEPREGRMIISGMYTGSGVNVGKYELQNGRTAIVRIEIESDEDEIHDDIENLPEVKRPTD